MDKSQAEEYEKKRTIEMENKYKKLMEKRKKDQADDREVGMD